MVYNVYSIRDTFTGFGQIFLEQSDPVAVRGFRFALSKKDSAMFTDPKDFDLMRIGSFDTDTGMLTSINPVTVCSAFSLRKEFDDIG